MTLAWWEVIGIPLLVSFGASLGWFFKRRDAQRNEERIDRRERQTADRALMRDEFESLRVTADALRGELREVTPQLANLRREYSEAVAREIELLDRFRDLNNRHTQFEAEARAERERLKVAIRLLHKRVRQLRTALIDNGIPVPAEPDAYEVLAGEEEESNNDD